MRSILSEICLSAVILIHCIRRAFVYWSNDFMSVGIHKNSIGGDESTGDRGWWNDWRSHKPSHSTYLLVSQSRVGLQGRQVAAEQGCPWSVLLTEDSAVDVVEAVTRHQSVSTGGTGETLEVVDVALRPHHHLIGRDRLATGAARTTVPKQPDIVTPTQDHTPFTVA